MRIAGERARGRLLIGAALAAVMTMGTLAAPVQASSAGWEAILGGHMGSRSAATRIADAARARGFRVYVQKISATNWEAEIFNGGRSRTEAEAVCGAACSRGSDEESEGRKSTPRSLSRAESAAEDSIDLILAGNRDKANRSAGSLDQLAQGDLAKDLEGVASKEELGELQARAAELARIAPSGEPIAVALAANHAFELIAQLFGKFHSDVPGSVMVLDYLDFEAKLRALAHDIDPLRATVTHLSTTWTGLAKTFPSGDKANAVRGRFDAHVAAMTSLATAGTDLDGLAREAQHGLDLVDEIEEVYAG